MSAAGSEPPRVGFAGMGRMGVPMALNVAAAGFPLTVYNRTRARCKPLASEGATVADSPAELGNGCDVVVSMLAGAGAVRDVLLGPDGVLTADGERGILVEMSTIGPAAARELAEAAAARGWDFVDAPVSGSTALAERAALTAMVGGSADAVEGAEPVLGAMTKARFHLGEAGAGAAMKLAVNVIIASSTQAISEALVLAERSGIERERAYEVIANSAVASPFVEYKRAAFIDPEGEPVGFALDLMQKDLDLALSLGREHRVPLLAASSAREGITVAAGLKDGGDDLVRIADSLRAISADWTRTTEEGR